MDFTVSGSVRVERTCFRNGPVPKASSSHLTSSTPTGSRDHALTFEQLSLTHFCETHGPKSVLCTQVLPLACALCLPPSPPMHARRSSESLRTQVHTSWGEDQAASTASLRRADTNSTLPTDFSRASTTVDSEPESPQHRAPSTVQSTRARCVR